ncbi:MAG: hypothetical protein M3365_06105 [Gemmatimonadota bacterium]|nr:hypothetical protein [Gemmatimonadota bacterium]
MIQRRLTALFGTAAILVLIVAALALSRPAPAPGPAGALGTLEPTAVAAASPQETPTAPVGATPSPPGPSASHTVAPCCPASPTPSDDRDVERSDLFWDRWLQPVHVDLGAWDAASLAEATQMADLVVRGRMTNIYIGEYWQAVEGQDPYPLAYATVEIDEILKGDPVSRTLGAVEVQLGRTVPDLNEVRALLPAHDHLWFLIFEPDQRPRTPPNQSDIAPFVYYATNEYQGILRDIGGVVRVIGRDILVETLPNDYYPLALDRTSYDLVVEQVRILGAPVPTLTVPIL